MAAIRNGLDLTREQFAVRYGLDIDAVRNWETARRTPDTAARSYLRAISGNPAAVQEALWAPQTGDAGHPGGADAPSHQRSDHLASVKL